MRRCLELPANFSSFFHMLPADLEHAVPLTTRYSLEVHRYNGQLVAIRAVHARQIGPQGIHTLI